MSKKLGSILLAILVVVGLAACTDLGNEVSGYYVSVDINPSIEFVVNEDDIVESWVFHNEDAAVLCADLDFEGMNIDDAIELFVTEATAAGYVDPEGEDNAVLITVITDDEETEEAVQLRQRISERIRQRLNTHFAKNYINALVITEDFTQEDLVLEANELGVSPGKLKLTYAALLSDETLVKEDVLDMPVKDILAIIREAHGEAFAQYKEAQWERLRERKQEMIQEHSEEVAAYRQANPQMTDEEVAAYMEQHQIQVREETKTEWQERLEQWQQNRIQNQENTQNTDTE